jgi:hypothetical protein
MKMTKQFRIEGYDNLFEIVDQSRTQTVYGAIAITADGRRTHSLYVTPFPDMVEAY